MTSGEPPSEARATTSVDDLVKRVHAMTPSDELGRTWWPWLIRAIEVGWLDQDDLLEVIAALSAGSDVGIEELAFEHIDGTVRVSFRGEEVHVSSSSVIDALAPVLHPLRESGRTVTEPIPASLLERHPELVAVGDALRQFGRGDPVSARCTSCGRTLEVLDPPDLGVLLVRCPEGHVSFRAGRDVPAQSPRETLG